jgi:hypothetical protein
MAVVMRAEKLARLSDHDDPLDQCAHGTVRIPPNC